MGSGEKPDTGKNSTKSMRYCTATESFVGGDDMNFIALEHLVKKKKQLSGHLQQSTKLYQDHAQEAASLAEQIAERKNKIWRGFNEAVRNEKKRLETRIQTTLAGGAGGPFKGFDVNYDIKLRPAHFPPTIDISLLNGERVYSSQVAIKAAPHDLGCDQISPIKTLETLHATTIGDVVIQPKREFQYFAEQIIRNKRSIAETMLPREDWRDFLEHHRWDPDGESEPYPVPILQIPIYFMGVEYSGFALGGNGYRDEHFHAHINNLNSSFQAAFEKDPEQTRAELEIRLVWDCTHHLYSPSLAVRPLCPIPPSSSTTDPFRLVAQDGKRFKFVHSGDPQQTKIYNWNRNKLEEDEDRMLSEEWLFEWERWDAEASPNIVQEDLDDIESHENSHSAKKFRSKWTLEGGIKMPNSWTASGYNIRFSFALANDVIGQSEESQQVIDDADHGTVRTSPNDGIRSAL